MISVCMATYNGERYIREQVESILSQLHSEDEVIISDDNSTDNTLNIIRSINDSRVKILSHQPIKSNRRYSNSHYIVTSNFENAIKYSSGDYIFLADQDDVWLPGKVDTCLQALCECTLVVTNMQIIDKDGCVVEEKHFLKKPIKSFIQNLVFPPFYGCCMAFRKGLKDLALPFPKNLIMHDAWLGDLASLMGEVSYIDKPYIQYRRHNSNVSPKHSKNPLFFKIWYRCDLACKIIVRFLVKKINH